MRKILIVFATAVLIAGCKKDAENKTCTSFKDGITANNKEQVKDIITGYIKNLPSDDYTADNINKLMVAISGQCNVITGLYCFDCIDTLPTQTEIWVEVIMAAGTVRKTIDITYYSGTNKMKFGNMHD